MCTHKCTNAAVLLLWLLIHSLRLFETTHDSAWTLVRRECKKRPTVHRQSQLHVKPVCIVGLHTYFTLCALFRLVLLSSVLVSYTVYCHINRFLMLSFIYMSSKYSNSLKAAIINHIIHLCFCSIIFQNACCK